MIDATIVRERLHYDEDTGVFTWRVVPRHPHKIAGTVAGARRCDGYVVITIGRKPNYAHRLAWLYMTGERPPRFIDHIDGDRGNNRWSNLRAATHAMNQQNKRKAKPGSKSGLLGAYPSGRGYRSMIRVGASVFRLGTFDTAQQAHEAYVKVKRRIHAGCTL